MKKSRIFIFALLAVLLVELPQVVSETTATTSFLANILFTNNLHAVVPGKLYRSAEMSAVDLEKAVRELNIAAVVDLRADKDEEDDEGVLERDATAKLGISYFHLPLIGSKLPAPESVKQLIDIYDHSTGPVLVHCSSGTHRSGVASAIWLLANGNSSIETAKEQLSPRYGFFRFERAIKSKLQGHPTIDQLIWDYEAANKATGVSFRDWIAAFPQSQSQSQAPAAEK